MGRTVGVGGEEGDHDGVGGAKGGEGRWVGPRGVERRIMRNDQDMEIGI